MIFQGMLEDIDTREKVAHSSYSDMDEIDFQILLADNYYVNPNSIHICFPVNIKRASNIELTATFSTYEIYQYLDAMLKPLQKNAPKHWKKIAL